MLKKQEDRNRLLLNNPILQREQASGQMKMPDWQIFKEKKP